MAIVRYNQSDDADERSRIYQKEIQPAFEKLVEFIINTFRYYYIGDLTMKQAQQEVVAFLVEKLERFKPESGKAFSYYSLVAKRFCIQRNKTNYKKMITGLSVSLDEGRLEDAVIENPYEEADNLEKFQTSFVEYWDTRIEQLCPKKTDMHVAMAVLELFRRRASLELFNKKALYIYIREIADISGLSAKPTTTPQITRVIKLIKGKYKEMYKDYLLYGGLCKNKVY